MEQFALSSTSSSDAYDFKIKLHDCSFLERVF